MLDTIWGWLGNQGLDIFITIIVCAVLYWAAWPITYWIGKYLTALDRSKQHRIEIRKRQKTIWSLICLVLRVVIVITGIFHILVTLGVDIAPLIASAGIIGIALGFGTQSLVKDVLSGIFIIGENQYRVGDYVEVFGAGVGDAEGTVEKLSLRTTKIRDRDGNVHFIPNGVIIHISNRTLGYGKIHFTFEVGADSDFDQITKVINKLGEAMMSDPEWKDKMLEAPHFVEIGDFSDGTIEITVSGKTLPTERWKATSEFRKRLLHALDAAKIPLK